MKLIYCFAEFVILLLLCGKIKRIEKNQRLEIPERENKPFGVPVFCSGFRRAGCLFSPGG